MLSGLTGTTTVKDSHQGDNLCHSCRKWEIPARSVFSRMFNSESDSALYCHFCMQRVCSVECVSEDKFVIPRLFNIEYDLRQHHVCTKAGSFLSKHNFVKIHNKSPQVALHLELKEFMIKRRQLHLVFD